LAHIFCLEITAQSPESKTTITTQMMVVIFNLANSYPKRMYATVEDRISAIKTHLPHEQTALTFDSSKQAAGTR
jgi:hypothetical protein